MKFALAFSLLAAIAVVGLSGCGDNKTEIPKDLNKTIPPPPIGTGGGGKMTGGSPSASEK
jgi:hypothetical protein